MDTKGMSPAFADASGSSHKAVAASGGAGEEIAPLHQLFGQVSVRIDSDTRATLVSLGGLDTRDFASQTLDDDDNAVFGPSKELFSVAINPQTGRPTNQYRLIPHPRNKIMYTGEDHFGNAHKNYHFYEVSVSREEMMFIRAGYGLPELVNMYIESALEGARARVMLTVPEREALNYMRSITGSGDKVEDFTYDQNGNKVGPSTEERETVSRAFETKLEQSLKDAARILGVERQGLDGRTLLGLHLRKLADHIHDETHFWGLDDPRRPGTKHPRIPTPWSYWSAYWYIQYQASYLSPAAIEARKYGYSTDSDSLKEQLQKLTRWPRMDEVDLSVKGEKVSIEYVEK